ncbi:hypothetical protein G3I59_07190 [Amycolatopsis rubida]|uniref:Uncharacterized protein n=1 Tax=Amycolatopsis rubida TaxID=112413 RepID=A0ABX0BKE3_9PSEU|nr:MULTISPECIES: hypothetical protein [Amycolatopsis]MYW90412.1 hypothetical protein [Amycolatopsis rubida]NEC55389.1 hypothetical protein [Amycolatopsis rubida]
MDCWNRARAEHVAVQPGAGHPALATTSTAACGAIAVPERRDRDLFVALAFPFGSDAVLFLFGFGEVAGGETRRGRLTPV